MDEESVSFHLNTNSMRCGRFKKKVAVTFEVNSLSNFKVPSQNIVQLVNS